MREVERVANEMAAIYHDVPVGDVRGVEFQNMDFLALARWHLREKRRARGRTLGYVAYKDGDYGRVLYDGYIDASAEEARDARAGRDGAGLRIARVVAVARKGAR